MIYKIYKITNKINGKIYIGYTSKTLKQRFKAHCKTTYSLIGRAIHKYGRKNFTIELLESSKDKHYIQDIREDYWINFYDSRNRSVGYNIAKGGGGGDKITYHPNRAQIILKVSAAVKKAHVEYKDAYERAALKRRGRKVPLSVRIRQSRALKNRIFTPEHRKKISIASKNRLKDKTKHPLYGKKHSAKTIEKMRKAYSYEKSQTLESRKKRRLAMLGRKKGPMSEEQKQRMRHPKSEQGRLNIAKTLQLRRATAKELCCPHCGFKSKSIMNMKKWHFDNCKYKNSHDALFNVIDILWGDTYKTRVGDKYIKMRRALGLKIKKDNSIFIIKNCFLNKEQDKIYYALHPEKIIGKTICVKYFSESTDKDGNISLRFPTVKAIYEEKRDC